jgi:hypothetical protein
MPPAPPAASSASSAPPPPSASDAAAAPASLEPDVLVKIRDEVAWRVDAGFDPRDKIVDDVAAVMERDHVTGVRDAIARETDAKLDEHAKAEATWKGATDCDKLDRALAALERGGLLVRPYYHATSSDAQTAIEDEVARAQAAGKRVRGFVVFSEENVREAVREGRLVVFSGAVPFKQSAYTVISADVLGRLQAAGLHADWPYHDPAYAITISPLAWKKRRTLRP